MGCHFLLHFTEDSLDSPWALQGEKAPGVLNYRYIYHPQITLKPSGACYLPTITHPLLPHQPPVYGQEPWHPYSLL